jgi:hypothetical protein
MQSDMHTHKSCIIVEGYYVEITRSLRPLSSSIFCTCHNKTPHEPDGLRSKRPGSMKKLKVQRLFFLGSSGPWASHTICRLDSCPHYCYPRGVLSTWGRVTQHRSYFFFWKFYHRPFPLRSLSLVVPSSEPPSSPPLASGSARKWSIVPGYVKKPKSGLGPKS